LVEDRGILRHADDDKTSAIVAHNLAAIAVAERDCPERGLAEIRATVNQERLDGYPFYAAPSANSNFAAGARIGKTVFRARRGSGAQSNGARLPKAPHLSL